MSKITKSDDIPFMDKFSKYKSDFNKKYITPLKYKYTTTLKFSPYFCTYDLETFKNSKGIATPYLFGLYIPNVGFKAFYGLDCVEKALEFIFIFDYPVKKVSFFAHFAGGFDVYLIMKDIIKNKGADKIEYLLDPSNNIFYLSFEHNNHIFEFKDSYKLIPIKLDRILKGFKIIVKESLGKLPFNHNWVNESTINYNNKIPSWLITHKELLFNAGILDKNENFNFQKYSIIYNEIDTIGLHKSIDKFFRILVDNFHIDFSHCITLPQLVMDLFRKRNLDDNTKIRMFSKKMQNIISKAYYGAHTAVYKPYGEKLYYYDINSLYPFCMLKTMPIGTPKKYDVSKGLNNFFGFALVKVTVPESLNIPVLPLYVKIEGVDRLVFPTGSFKGYYFSEELKYAESLGCKIELIEAWEFQKGNNVFNDYIEPLFELKRTGNKDERDVFKLCLNTLYGKWGQHREYRLNVITGDMDLMEQIERKFTNIKQITFDENLAGYSFDKAPNPNLFEDSPELFNELSNLFEKGLESRPVNIAIAAAITSYARIEIDHFKRLPGYEVYYSDTDCVVLNKPLPKEYLGDGLGQMKNELSDDNYIIEKDHEYYLEKGIFLRDKLYSIKPVNGNPITKFSGLHKNYITKELHETIENIYLTSGKNITLNTEISSKNINTFEVKNNEKTQKTFTFNYNKRIMIRNNEGTWVDTKPIHISSVKIQNFDLEPIIGRQNREENLSKKVYLSHKDVKINHYNVFNTDYKKFDGFLLAYIAPIYDTNYSNNLILTDKFLIETNNLFEKAKNILLANLYTLAEKAIEENILVDGIGYLISEEYITPEGIKKINTISYLNSFNSLNELISIYEQHLNGLIEGGQESGNMLVLNDNVDKTSYNIKTLYLRILIPKELIKSNLVPAKLLQLESGITKLLVLESGENKIANKTNKISKKSNKSNLTKNKTFITKVVKAHINTISKIQIRKYSSNINKELVPYENKNFLKPILNVKDKLLAPIVYDKYILSEIDKIQFILTRFNDLNFVKLWLTNKLQEDKIIINAKLNENTKELLDLIISIENETIIKSNIEGLSKEISFISSRYFNEIKKDNLECKPIFSFKNNEFITTLLKNNKLNKLYSACYIITFNNKVYYYIGSSTDFKKRFNTHTLNINNYKENKNNTLTGIFKEFLDSIRKNAGFNINIIYLSHNYLTLFQTEYPYYKLSKGEFILLNKISDFLVKTLEISLFEKFHPKLNSLNKVSFKHFEWNDEYLNIYRENNNNKEYLKASTYGIYGLSSKTRTIADLAKFLKLKFTKDEEINYYNKINNDILIRETTLQDLCQRYNLNYKEVLNNLNTFHYYNEITSLRNPLKIVKIK